jgi:hypothetical protein
VWGGGGEVQSLWDNNNLIILNILLELEMGWLALGLSALWFFSPGSI